MVPIAKTKLEEICVLYLNHQPRVRAVARILLNRPDAGNANWSIDQIEPRLDLHDYKTSLKAVRELQSHFRMVG
jgi:hypothetical protein